MEPEELRKLRIAHELTPNDLAAMLDVTSEDVLAWEAETGSPCHEPITREVRRRILRALALCRARAKERDLIAAARARTRPLPARSLAPVLVRR